MATIYDYYGGVYQAAGELQAVCACHAPAGGSGMPWYYTLINMFGIVHFSPKEREVYLALSGGNLVYVAMDEDREVCGRAVFSLSEISNVQIASRGEWEHEVRFDARGKTHKHVTCAYIVGSQTPPELQQQVHQMEAAVVSTLQQCNYPQ